MCHKPYIKNEQIVRFNNKKREKIQAIVQATEVQNTIQETTNSTPAEFSR